MATSIDEGLLIEVARLSAENAYDTIRKDLHLVVSESEMARYLRLEDICYAKEMRRGGKVHKAALAEAFESPLYSAACKKYCAATHLSNEFILLPAGRFLTEKIILSYLENVRFKSFSASYFAAIMGTKYLSERIISATIKGIGDFDDFRASKILELIPDHMITPSVVTSWVAKSLQVAQWATGEDIKSAAPAVAARRLKRLHPEYEGFPDEWVIKVFCGSQA